MPRADELTGGLPGFIDERRPADEEHLMANVPPTRAPAEPGDPSNRWPWLALILGLVVVLVAIGFFLFNRTQTVNIGIEGTTTPNPVARAGTASPGPPPTLAPPTLATSAALAPTATPVPAPTNTPAPPTPSPAPTPPPTEVPPTPAPPTQPPAQAAPAPGTPPPGQAAPPAAANPGQSAPTAASTPAPGAGQPGAAGTAPAGTQTPASGGPAGTPTVPTAASTPTPFAGQVANAGGLGNTRSDVDAALGPPTGETPDHLVAYRKNNVEYHVGFAPDLNGRAALIVELPQQPLALEQAQAEGHKLLPKDAQPPNATAEGNNQFAVERYTSQTLAQALPPETFAANRGQPGQFLIVYARDQQGRIMRIILGPGNDPNALMNEGR